jgi:hypothetical protein
MADNQTTNAVDHHRWSKMIRDGASDRGVGNIIQAVNVATKLELSNGPHCGGDCEEVRMRYLSLALVVLSLQGCAVGLLANAMGATPGNVPALHPEQTVAQTSPQPVPSGPVQHADLPLN